MTRAFEYLSGIPWAITPEALRKVAAIALREHERPGAIQTRTGGRLENTRRARNRDGVAVVPITGPIFRYANLFTEISGATSSEVLAQDFNRVLEDPSVERIVLDVNSPGGTVDGTEEIAELIFRARGRKPITAFVSGIGASAAYWIASAADEVVAGRTAELGSVGVVLEVVDFSGMDEKRGIRRLDIVSSQSPNKRGDPFEDDDARARLQTIVDDTADVFIEAVARNRGVSVETVLNDFGGGGLFVGEAAVEAGLADRLSTLEEEITRADADRQRAARAVALTRPQEGTMDHETGSPAAEQPAIDRSYLDENHADLVTEIRAQAATEERERILAIQALEGPDDVIAECVNDPEVSAGDAALQILEARREREKARAKAHLASRSETEEDLEAPEPSTQPQSEATEDRARAKRVVALHQKLTGSGPQVATA